MKVEIKTKTKSICQQYQSPTLISDMIRKSDIDFFMPCGGKGTCGNCKLKVSGMVSKSEHQELGHLSFEEVESGIRLACMTTVLGDCVIDISDLETSIQDPNNAHSELKKLSNSVYGVAIDIGTTTIAAYLIDMIENKIEAYISETNRQVKFGADVISRIEYANHNGVTILREVILNQIDQFIQQLLPDKNNHKIVITGNTVMLHILVGMELFTLGKAPFTPVSLFGYDVEIKNQTAYLPKCFSAFVGADISCAILASDMLNKEETALLLDIGTNGEIVLLHQGNLVCCSTAAGPAFEGAKIKNGVAGIEGAISKVFAQGSNLFYNTISGKNPIGICGSGIIDAVAVMLINGVLDQSGRIKQEGHALTNYVVEIEGELRFYIGRSNIYLTQNDIREVQLAKSAINSGIKTLLNELNLTNHQIDRFYIAGGFGSAVDKKNAAQIGIFDKELLNKAQVIGNGAAIGATMILMDEKKEFEFQKVKDIKTIELSTNQYFLENFIENMNF